MAEARRNEHGLANNLENIRNPPAKSDIGELLRFCEYRVNSRPYKEKELALDILRHTVGALGASKAGDAKPSGPQIEEFEAAGSIAQTARDKIGNVVLLRQCPR